MTCLGRQNSFPRQGKSGRRVHTLSLGFETIGHICAYMVSTIATKGGAGIISENESNFLALNSLLNE